MKCEYTSTRTVDIDSSTSDFEKNSKKREFSSLRASRGVTTAPIALVREYIFFNFLRAFQRRVARRRPCSIASPVMCVISCIFNVNFIENNESGIFHFPTHQCLELQRLLRRSDAARWLNALNALQSREMALNIFLFDSTRFCCVHRHSRRSFRRRKTENSHHVWRTQLHNFHFHRLRATHRALFTALPNVNDVQKMYTDGRRLKYAHKTSFAWVEG